MVAIFYRCFSYDRVHVLSFKLIGLIQHNQQIRQDRVLQTLVYWFRIIHNHSGVFEYFGLSQVISSCFHLSSHFIDYFRISIHCVFQPNSFLAFCIPCICSSSSCSSVANQVTVTRTVGIYHISSANSDDNVRNQCEFICCSLMALNEPQAQSVLMC